MYISTFQIDEGDPYDDSDLTGSEISMSDSEEEVASDSDSDAWKDENFDDENEHSEDSLVSAIEDRRTTLQNKILPIRTDGLFTDLSFHPSKELIAISCVSGNIEIHSYSVDGNIHVGSIEAHTKACRAVEFSEDGGMMFTVGKDKSIIISDVHALDIKMFIDNAHHAPLTTLCVPDKNMLSTGDEEGVIKIWDTRYSHTPVLKVHDVQDYVSCIIAKNSYKIACTSGDGTLTSYDLRAKKKLQQSAPFETDLTCCSSTHCDTMIVCGTLRGGLFLFYKWSDFTDIAGTYKQPKAYAINTILSISDNIILSGMEDGQLRAFHFFPHKEIGIVGQHELLIDSLDISHDGNIIASLSPDQTVKFWDISYLEGFELSELKKTKANDSTNLPSSEFDDRRTFFSEL